MKTITLNPFDAVSIDNAINELKAYQKSLKDKCLQLIDAMCADGEEYAKVRWEKHIWSGHTIGTIMGYRRGNVGIISVSGENAAWIEFGTGVYAGGAQDADHLLQKHWPGLIPPSVGGPGGFGMRANFKRGWTYYDEYTGHFYHTTGHISDPIMWDTAQQLKNEVDKYARVAFKS